MQIFWRTIVTFPFTVNLYLYKKCSRAMFTQKCKRSTCSHTRQKHNCQMPDGGKTNKKMTLIYNICYKAFISFSGNYK